MRISGHATSDHFRAEAKHLAGSKLLRYATVKRLAT